MNGLNESPYEKVGKFIFSLDDALNAVRLNESPYEKVGKSIVGLLRDLYAGCLNESPYEKVGKSVNGQVVCGRSAASMKVPTKK